MHKEDVPRSGQRLQLEGADSFEAQSTPAMAQSCGAHTLGSESLLPIVQAGSQVVCWSPLPSGWGQAVWVVTTC